jgi:hypothetical protein
VEEISTRSHFNSQAQPEPKRPTPAALNFSLKVSKLPKAPVMACATCPTGAPPAFGPMIFQNIEWLMWPPPLLRTAVRIFSGTMAQLFANSSSIVLPARSGADSSALLRLVT